jgi:hypothetical protein
MLKVKFSLGDGLGSDDMAGGVALDGLSGAEFEVVGVELAEVGAVKNRR